MASLSPPKSLIFDLEVAPGKSDQTDRIFMVGALRPDTGAELERKVEKDLAQALAALDDLGHGASFVLGHNVISESPAVGIILPIYPARGCPQPRVSAVSIGLLANNF